MELNSYIQIQLIEKCIWEAANNQFDKKLCNSIDILSLLLSMTDFLFPEEIVKEFFFSIGYNPSLLCQEN